VFSGYRARILLGAAVLAASTLWHSQAVSAEAGAFTNELWTLVIRSEVEVCPAIAPDGTIHLGTFNGQLWAISPDGKKKWVFQAGREIKSSAAIGQDGTVYFGCRDRNLYAVSPEGKLRWKFATGGWIDSSPALSRNQTVYFGSWDNTFYALGENGAKKWQFQTGGPIVSSPALGFDGRIYFGSHDQQFYALTPEGTKAWQYGCGGSIISSPAVDRDGTLYFTSVDGVFHAVNGDGTAKWRLQTGGVSESSPVIGQDGTLYVGVNQDLWAIDPTGAKKWVQPWSVTPPLLIRTSPVALAGGWVCFLSGSGSLIELKQPPLLESMYLPSVTLAPTVGTDGRHYAGAHVVNTGQVLKAFQGGRALANSSWPKFRGDLANTGRPNP
jgi:outer membrane protein assembly factor BamB